MRNQLTRRTFLQTSAGLAAASGASGFTIVKAESVRGTTANSMVEVGWIGLGGRGTRDAYLLEKTGKAKFVAVADYFQYRIDNLFKPIGAGQDPETVQRPKLEGFDKKNAFVGVDAYKAITGSKVDAVLMATPPGFRPEHFKAAVAAQKHVFMEKPLAVDTWGCHVIDAAGKQAIPGIRLMRVRDVPASRRLRMLSPLDAVGLQRLLRLAADVDQFGSR